MQENSWNYCRIIREPTTGKLFMLHLFPETGGIKVAYEVKQLIDITPEGEQYGQVS